MIMSKMPRVKFLIYMEHGKKPNVDGFPSTVQVMSFTAVEEMGSKPENSKSNTVGEITAKLMEIAAKLMEMTTKLTEIAAKLMEMTTKLTHRNNHKTDKWKMHIYVYI